MGQLGDDGGLRRDDVRRASLGWFHQNHLADIVTSSAHRNLSAMYEDIEGSCDDQKQVAVVAPLCNDRLAVANLN